MLRKIILSAEGISKPFPEALLSLSKGLPKGVIFRS
jgi:hypothetical protein